MFAPNTHGNRGVGNGFEVFICIAARRRSSCLLLFSRGERRGRRGGGKRRLLEGREARERRRRLGPPTPPTRVREMWPRTPQSLTMYAAAVVLQQLQPWAGLRPLASSIACNLPFREYRYPSIILRSIVCMGKSKTCCFETARNATELGAPP